MLPLFGLASVPAWLTPWASLLITSLLIPRARCVRQGGRLGAGEAFKAGWLAMCSWHPSFLLASHAALLPCPCAASSATWPASLRATA